MRPDATQILEGRKALRDVADPRVFPAFIAVLAVAIIGLLIYWQRQDMREERGAFIAALKENTAALVKLGERVEALERRR